MLWNRGKGYSHNTRMQQICIKEGENLLWLGGKVDPQEIVQETETLPYYQAVYSKTRIGLR